MRNAELIGLDISLSFSLYTSAFRGILRISKKADSNQREQAYYSKSLTLRRNVTFVNRCTAMLSSLATDSEIDADVEISRRLSENSIIILHLFNLCYDDLFRSVNILIKSPRYYLLIVFGEFLTSRS